MKKAPESYLNRKRPPILKAIALEGRHLTFDEAVKSLERKGYFSPNPRPWKLGERDRGHGHRDFAVLDRFGDLVAEFENRSNAEFVISAVNAHT